MTVGITLSRFLLTASMLLLPSLALASEGGEEGGWSGFFWHLANLIVFAFILVKFVGPQLKSFHFQRRKEITGALEEARRLHAEAEARDAEWSRKLDGLEAERGQIREQAGEIGKLEHAKILEQARLQAERIRRDAERAAEQELARAKARLHAEAVRVAMGLAEKMVRENLNEADQQRLLEEYLQNMERT